jgi:hypothetical protein
MTLNLLQDIIAYFQHLNPIREGLAVTTFAAAVIAFYYVDKAEKAREEES